eukprot:gb/GECG01000367.1/.p1 GENE.gb/GECG01000367.1/~~gb/GECG01000367.1/.p1  ORF type:complete len:1171 (+),score=119.63 gb/GECG01000367.1/:1-3513(+)
MSLLFDPYRAVGVVAPTDTPALVSSTCEPNQDDSSKHGSHKRNVNVRGGAWTPKPILQTLGSENFMTVPIGKAFHVYNCARLSLSLVSPPGEHPINNVAAHKELTVTTSGDRVMVWHRVTKLGEFVEPDEGTVVCVTEMGSYIALVHETGFLRVVDINAVFVQGREAFLRAWPNGSIIAEMPLHLAGLPTVVVHPATYLNKLLIATDAGAWYIVNFNTKKLIYSSENFTGSTGGELGKDKSESGGKRRRITGTSKFSGSARVGITSIEQSPAVDVFAFGLSDGRIVLHDIKKDEHLTSFVHSAADTLSAAGAISTLSFCTDPMQKPLLLSATDEGAFALWDLKEKALHYVDAFAHKGNVCAAWFLPRQTSFVTVGTDNSIKMWTLDSLDIKPKQLRSREGHRNPPRQIAYYAGNTVATLADGADARVCEILSAGDDCSFRMFHTAIDRQNRELSQKSIAKRAKRLHKDPDELRLPPIVAFACSERHHGIYYDVVTAHKNHNQAYVWNYEKKALGDVALPLPTIDSDGSRKNGPTEENVTAVAISRCGNFALVGGSFGTIAKFNMQSGAPRGEYPMGRQWNKLAMQGKKFRGTHSNPLPRPNRDVGKGLGPRDMLKVPDSVDRSLRSLLGKDFTLPSEREVQAPSQGLAAGRSSLDGATQHHTRQSEIDAVTAGFNTSNLATWRHVGEIRGLAVSRLNDELYSSGADGTVRWWTFNDHKVTHILYTGSPITMIELHPGNGLLGLACDDLSIRIVDTITRRQVRRFPGHDALVSDISFSADGRWLISASHDASVKVWDIPTARCIDWLKFEKPVRSLTVSPTNEYLITTHSDDVGLYMWSNKAHFSEILQDKVPSEPIPMDLPRTQHEEDSEFAAQTEATSEADEENANVSETSLTPSVKVRNSIILSGKPSSQWQHLSKLDEIAKRNKPKEPPKEPEKAPFFLPTVAGINPVFAPPEEHKPEQDSDNQHVSSEKVPREDGWNSSSLPPEEEVFGSAKSKEEEPKSKHGKSRVLQSPGTKKHRTKLAKLLNAVTEDDTLCIIQAYRDNDEHSSFSGETRLQAIEDYLVDLSPAKVDVEIRSLCLDSSDEAGLDDLYRLLVYFLWQIHHLKCFEITQAQLQLTLKVYPFIITATERLRMTTACLKEAQRRASDKTEDLFHHSLCLIRHFSNIQ